MRSPPSTTLVAATIVTFAFALPACGSSESGGSTSPQPGGERAEGGDSPSEREANVLATSKGRGEFPATLARATVQRPAAVKVKVTPTPPRATVVSWSMTCRKDGTAGSTQGRFRVRKKTTKRLRTPLRDSDVCEVSASAQMLRRGKLKVQIIR
jgi:hypothetical protein